MLDSVQSLDGHLDGVWFVSLAWLFTLAVPTGIVTAEMTAQRRQTPPTTREPPRMPERRPPCPRGHHHHVSAHQPGAARALRRTRPNPDRRHAMSTPTPLPFGSAADLPTPFCPPTFAPPGRCAAKRSGRPIAAPWPWLSAAAMDPAVRNRGPTSITGARLADGAGCDFSHLLHDQAPSCRWRDDAGGTRRSCCSATPWPSTCQSSPMQRLRVLNGHTVLHCPGAPRCDDLLRHTAGLTYEILAPADPAPIRTGQLASRSRTNREFAQTLAALPLMF